MPTKDWLQCQLALAEGFTNAVRHAHRGLPPEIPIQVEVFLKPQEIEICIWDCGPPFDLDDFLKKQDWSQQSLAEHGQGLLILQKISAHLSYTRSEDNRNCLRIIKQLSAL
jgi:serine/threonine-protein kinase RsbW